MKSAIRHLSSAICYLALLSACATAHHHVEDAPLVTRLTLVPEGDHTLVKINGVESRSLVTNANLTQPLQLLMIDSTLSDFHVITPAPSSIPGVLSMPAPKSEGYRIWADIHPNAALSKKQREEFPSADIGRVKAGHIDKMPAVAAHIDEFQLTLALDHPLMADEESTITLRAADADGKPAHCTGDLYGFYDDLHSVVHVTLDSESRFTLTPKKAAFIKLFAVLSCNGHALTAPFGMSAAKAN